MAKRLEVQCETRMDEVNDELHMDWSMIDAPEDFMSTYGVDEANASSKTETEILDKHRETARNELLNAISGMYPGEYE